MAYFKVCEFCGAHLDSAEKCDCREEIEATASRWSNATRKDEDGQLELVFEIPGQLNFLTALTKEHKRQNKGENNNGENQRTAGQNDNKRIA